MAPRCWITASSRRRRWLRLDCSSIKEARDLSSERRETVRFLSLLAIPWLTNPAAGDQVVRFYAVCRIKPHVPQQLELAAKSIDSRRCRLVTRRASSDWHSLTVLITRVSNPLQSQNFRASRFQECRRYRRSYTDGFMKPIPVGFPLVLPVQFMMTKPRSSKPQCPYGSKLQ